MSGAVNLAPTSERYVDARELAAQMDVSITTIKRWVALGMPSETWGMRVRRFLPSAAMQWAATHDTIGPDRDRTVNAARR